MHSTVCTFPDPARTGFRVRRAFWFPPHSAQPEVIWLRLSTDLSEDGSDDIDRAHLAQLWGREVDEQDLRSMIVRQNHRRLRNLKHHLAILFDDSAGNGRVGLNLAIAGLVEHKPSGGSRGKSGGMKYSQGSSQSGWRGPVLVLAMEIRVRGEPFEICDLERSEMRDVVDVLDVNGPDGKAPSEDLAVDVWKLKPGRKVHVHMVRCHRKEIEMSNAKTRDALFSDTQIAAMRAQNEGEELTLGKMLGIPLRMFPLSSARVEAHPRHSVCHDEDDPCDMIWLVGILRWHKMNPGLYNMGFHTKACVGDAMILREDGKELTTQQFRTLVWLAKEIGHDFREAFHHSETEQERTDRVNDVLAVTTKQGWLKYFEEVKEAMVRQGFKDWKNAAPV